MLLFDSLKQDYPGGMIAVGMAANQIGFLVRMLALRDDPRTPICLVNPQIVKCRGTQFKEETCLSLPGISVKVTRPKIVKVRGLNQYMKPVTYTFRSLQARVICHEAEHLDGKLIIDYLDKETE